MVACLLTLVIGKFRATSPLVGASDFDHAGSWILAYVIEVMTLFLPLLILRLAIGAQILRRLPKLASINRAAFCALLGLSIPYVLAFSYLPYALVLSPGTPGQGIGILLALAVTPVAGALAFFGWRVALFFPPRERIRCDIV